uniref:Uncharacterized protein n=1 Tax=Pithovirus LCPAC404 TaxID=2506597 RepID=A0A481ZCW3_9VIRU|nr:MAG: hypothetical protein LCPAC404_02200 [Pithovirus LCPAC404]
MSYHHLNTSARRLVFATILTEVYGFFKSKEPSNIVSSYPSIDPMSTINFINQHVKIDEIEKHHTVIKITQDGLPLPSPLQWNYTSRKKMQTKGTKQSLLLSA